MKKHLIIGSTQYSTLMFEAKSRLEKNGFVVRMPTFDDSDLNELSIVEKNRGLIEWADEVHLFWDQRSMGTVFDLGMVFMARKPLVIEYLEDKTIPNLVKMYSKCEVDASGLVTLWKEIIKEMPHGESTTND